MPLRDKKATKGAAPLSTMGLTPVLPSGADQSSAAGEPKISAGGDEQELLDVSAPTVSGEYIRLQEQGKLDRMLKLQKEREQLQFGVMAANAELSQFNNPIYLANFYISNSGSGYKFGVKLKQRANGLEEEKKKLNAKIAVVESEMASISSLILKMSPAAPALDPSSQHTVLKPTPFLEVGEDTNPFVLVRDLMIKKLALKRLNDKEICANLDLELTTRDAPPLGIPTRWLHDYELEWTKKYKWNFYQAAYSDSRTKNSMQKMISKAKARLA